jgi:hypothetical protein
LEEMREKRDKILKTSRQIYEGRTEGYGRFLLKLQKKERDVSNLRLGAFIVEIGIAVLTYLRHLYILLAASVVVFAALFIYMILLHEKLIRRIKYVSLLKKINEASLKRVRGEWHSFEDDGKDFVEDSHRYTGDLDIFGKNSLFQMISTAQTYGGRVQLKELLSGAVGAAEAVRERQEAVEELSSMMKWRQYFQAEGMHTSRKMNNPQELIAWGKEKNPFYRKPWVIALFRICPTITVLLVTAGFIMDLVPGYLPGIALLLQFALISCKVEARYRMFNIFENYDQDLRVYYRLLKLFEQQKFQSAGINRLKKAVKNPQGREAFRQMDKLSAIVDSMGNRRNLFYILFNTLTLWDFQNLIALERWKQEAGAYMEAWFEALGRVEALASLAVIAFENPHWAIPVIGEDKAACLKAKGLGHPLLIGNRVNNDVYMGEDRKVLLITGSNMSGKSTLLRTTGINLVLAYAGAPVCAAAFETVLMDICTCMRIKDNLEESISSFYAELLRIKKIVGEAESGKKVFYLLDEIFRGTNSQDRHIGARVLINKLSRTASIGLVSTHDLELCDLEKQNPQIANYHFQEYYEEGTIHFDYMLRQGPSTTRNALHLMRLAGIEVDEEMNKDLCR